MKIFKKLFLKNKQKVSNKEILNELIDHHLEVGKLVKEARIQKNLSIEELSRISKIPKYTINAIEDNNKKFIPKYPFLRSILFKLEDCLSLKKNTLVSLVIRDSEPSKNKQKKFLLKKFDFINTWEGIILYFFVLITIVFILKRYFISNVSIIEIQTIEEKIEKKESFQ